MKKQYRVKDTYSGIIDGPYDRLRDALYALRQARSGYDWPDELVLEEREVGVWHTRSKEKAR